MTNSRMIAVSFENVCKVYRHRPWAPAGVTAVDRVSFAVPAGAAFALLGPNRAGKTTLIKLLLSLSRPTAGTVTRLGQPIADRRTLARVGYMHENHAFPRYLSAAEVLSFYGGVGGLDAETLPAKVSQLLERVGLADRGREPIARFSKGMVQRLGLAQAILNQPELLVLDEPTEGLDLAGRELLKDVVRETVAAGRTVVMVSHSLAEVQSLCDRAAVLTSGRLVWQGGMTDLCRNGPLEHALKTLYAQREAA
jgi:ABC-2 type transport system ATP-binding protein